MRIPILRERFARRLILAACLFHGWLPGNFFAREAFGATSGADESPEAAISIPEDFGAVDYEKGKLLFSDSFEDLDDWIVEQQPDGTAEARDGALEVVDDHGATIWYRHRLNGPVMIEYEVMPRSSGRVSDMNCYWMATENEDAAPFTIDGNGEAKPKRGGKFSNYHHLRLYYVGCGGHNNSATRFRRLSGSGERPMLPEHDLTDEKYLLEPDRTYQLRLVANGNRVQYFRDGECYFDILDPHPYESGWFGLRMVNTSESIRNFRVHALQSKAPAE